MKNAVNFLFFNVCWFAAVEGAARGSVWIGPAAFALMVGVHLAWATPRGERVRESLYLAAVGCVGLLADSAMQAAGLIDYATAGTPWPYLVVPPWIVSLWIGFATLPRLSLAWLTRRPMWWAAVLGAIGGPMSFFAGTRMGPIAAGDELFATLGVLAVEYGVLMPFMLRLAPAHARRADTARTAGTDGVVGTDGAAATEAKSETDGEPARAPGTSRL